MFRLEFISQKTLREHPEPEDAPWTPMVQSFATEGEAELEMAWLQLDGSDTVYRVRPSWRAKG